MPNQTVYLKAYTPPTFSILSLSLNVALYEDETLVSSQMHLKREQAGPLHLNGDELTLVSIQCDGQALSEQAYRMVAGDLIIDDCPDECHLEIVTRISPQNNTKLSGLYRSRDLFCTQCEAEGFRRITYFLDRPDVLTTYTTRISADKKRYPILLSNGNLIDAGDEASGRHYVVWHDPFKKPAYLFALVAGTLACVKDQFVTMSGREIELCLYVEPGNEDKCAHALSSLKKAMRWDEEKYGREYDLDIFMIVAVSDFNMGAMENKGLNIFNDKYILARKDTASDLDYAGIESVVAHEYFHNWTGNRVTCRDWFQLSLKEGLTVFRDQEFSRDMNSRDVCRIQDVNVLRATQFPEDAGAMAHAVQPEAYEEINNFYTATIYNKGAEVIRMQHTLLGPQGFRQGMDLYFERHDGQAVTIEDFVAAMSDANAFDLSQFKRWYQQAGTPIINAHEVYEGGQLALHLTQTCPPTPSQPHKLPFHIPIKIAFFDENGQRFTGQPELIELKEASQTFYFQLPSRPIVSLLREFSAPVRLNSNLSEAALLVLLRFETDGYAKWQAAQALALNVLRQSMTAPRHMANLSQALITAFRHVLADSDLDLSLKALLLTPPGFEQVFADIPEADVIAIEDARAAYRKALGHALAPELKACYQSLAGLEDHGLDASAFARRALKNIILYLLMKSDETEVMPLCLTQFNQSQTMTDKAASFAMLVNSHDTRQRLHAIDTFYHAFQHDALVLDKWFSVQASSEHADTLTHVRALLQHSAFSFKNPNKVRAVVGAFCQANPRYFHAIDGSGYAFLTEMLLVLDPINPQIAARLITPFTRAKRLDKVRQDLIKSQLIQLSASQLSRDLREMVDKSLEALEQ